MYIQTSSCFLLCFCLACSRECLFEHPHKDSVRAKEKICARSHQFTLHLFSLHSPFSYSYYQSCLQSTKIKGPCAYPQGVSAVLFHCCLGSIFSPVVHFSLHTQPLPTLHHCHPQLPPSSSTTTHPVCFFLSLVHYTKPTTHIIIPNPLIPTGTQITTGYQP